ncbi:hypothetical protein PIB30_104026 [Stylosanthes scabra]|uniref:Uncharacterized protein n=1 Tax=Stylosanthes scabra TaxID=79078 RepID=A0ABU6VYB0_9FABA|nr:hypothetical protein [Stylosanthes scabra]
MSKTWPKRDIYQDKGGSAKLTSNPPRSRLDHVLTWAKRGSTMNKGSLAIPPHITFGPRFLPSPNVTHAVKPHQVTFWHVKTWQKRDQPIPLPKLTQANLEQARSHFNIFKISSQAHTPSFQVFSTFSGGAKLDQPPHHIKATFESRLAKPKRDPNVR